MAKPLDLDALRKKFPAKVPPKKGKSSKAAVKAIAREYELKKAQLVGRAPVLKKGIVFYGVVLIVLILLGALVLSVLGKGGRATFSAKGKDYVSATNSIEALAIALGRYKFHVGAYPTTEEGLAVLAYRKPDELRRIRRRHKTWDGPYIRRAFRDPWGRDFVYETRPEGGPPVLYSAGPDGKFGTDDDILPNPETFERAFRDTSWTNHWAPAELRDVVVAPDEATRRKIREEMEKYD